MKLKILIIATEPSGDKLGANLIDGLHSELKGKGQLVFQGIGGPLMRSRGVTTLFNFNELSVMGFFEIIPKLPKILSVINRMVKYALVWKPDLIITIDSPDFSLRIAKKIKQKWPTVKTIHYVAPSVWAWRGYRARTMGKFLDHVLAILPFEPPFMEAAGMTCDFVGHPIVSEDIPSNQEIRLFRSSLGIERETPIVSILPGSRRAEIVKMMPIYLKSLESVAKKFPNLVFIIASPPNVCELVKSYLKFSNVPVIQLYEKDDPMKFEERKRMLFSTSLAALATSGTITLEIARMGAPLLVGYRASFMTEILLKNFVKLKSATLINILTNQAAIPELLFSKCNYQNIATSLIYLLTDSTQADRQRDYVKFAMNALGANDLDPKIRAARSILRFLDK